MISYNTGIVLLGAGLLGASAGAVGSFAVLRRRALTGDALAHASLPGLCLAFLVMRERNLPAMLLGALATGVLGIAIISGLRRWTRVREDAAIGIVLSVFFGAGIVLWRLIQNLPNVGNKAGVTSYILGSAASMTLQDVQLIAALAAACLSGILLFYKEFKLVVFDPSFGRVQGWPMFKLDLLLMTLIAVTVVIGLPAVGVVLVAALLILPGTAARFWTDRLGLMLMLSAGFGLGTGLVGTALSARFSGLPAGPIIVLVGTALFLVSMLLAPRRGLVARLVAQRRFGRELQDRNLLRVLFDLSEPSLPARRPIACGEVLAMKSWEPAQLRKLLGAAERRRHVICRMDDHCVLTDEGLKRAAEVARSHRLWQAFLTEHADLAGGVVNLAADSVDDLLPAYLVDELSAELRSAGRWPAFSEQRLPEVAR